MDEWLLSSCATLRDPTRAWVPGLSVPVTRSIQKHLDRLHNQQPSKALNKHNIGSDPMHNTLQKTGDEKPKTQQGTWKTISWQDREI